MLHPVIVCQHSPWVKWSCQMFWKFENSPHTKKEYFKVATLKFVVLECWNSVSYYLTLILHKHATSFLKSETTEIMLITLFKILYIFPGTLNALHFLYSGITAIYYDVSMLQWSEMFYNMIFYQSDTCESWIT